MIVAVVAFLVFGTLFLVGFAWARGGFTGPRRDDTRLRGLMVVFGVWGIVAATICAMALGAGDSLMAVATAILVAVNALLLWATYRRVAR